MNGPKMMKTISEQKHEKYFLLVRTLTNIAHLNGIQFRGSCYVTSKNIQSILKSYL